MAHKREVERWYERGPEPHRTPAEKDRDRIVHSSAFRRLQGKSQVFGAQTTDYFRNRLTHSLECAQIGRAIARRCSESQWKPIANTIDEFATVVEAACLAHDMGHPPFGHNGEEALSEIFAEHVPDHLFEGNAHSFRIVTYVEPKQFAEVSAGEERWLGLNLTRATLKAIQKYPWTERDPGVDPDHPKFSVFNEPDDLQYHEWLWKDVKRKKTIAADVMDVADDIAYATHDFEDGVWSGMIPLPDLVRAEGGAVARIYRKILEREKQSKLTVDDVGAALRKLFDEAFAVGGFVRDAERAWMLRPFERSRENVSYLKRLSAALIGLFIDRTTAGGKFRKPAGETALFINILTAVAWVWMIERTDLKTRQFGQRRVVRELFEGYVDKPAMLPRQREVDDIRRLRLDADEEHRRICRLICDHIAGMTDQYALRAHREMYRGESPFEIRFAY